MKRLVLKTLGKYKWKITLQLILIAINIYLLTCPAKIIGIIIDLLYNIEGNKQEIIRNTYYLIGVCVILLIVRMGWKYYEVYINRAFEKDVKNKLFERVLRIKLSNLQNIKNGEIMSYFVRDINEIRRAVWRTFSHGARIIVCFIVTTFAMAKGVNIKLTIATMCPIIITSYIIIKLKNQVEKSFRKAQDKFTAMSEYVQESTDSIRTTKAYSCEKEQLKEFIRKNRQVRSSNNSVDIYSNLITACINICFGLCYGISLIYGANLVLQGKISTGDLVAFNGYIGLFVGPVTWMPNLITSLKKASISYYRLENVYNLEREKISVNKNKNSEEIQGNIEIKDLNFFYPNYIEGALKNINLSIKKGETLGVIGTIGSGKTTLMNLLLRLYNVEDGKIYIDDKDINQIPIEVLRSNICYITQDNFLFSTTLKENIAVFKEQYDDDEIKDSTRKAMIYNEIMEMPEGINTVIGERGVDLSGGQKQRIVISRAFFYKSKIVIFDDTFSALDNKTEHEVLENIKKLTQEKTCIIISNRISDVKISDKIIVLDNGEIIESGNHNSLLNQKGKYYEFYMQQSSQSKESFLA